MRRTKPSLTVLSVAVALIAGLAVAPTATAQQLPSVPNPATLSSGAGISAPQIQDPLDTPQARRALRQAWKGIPREAKQALNLPTPLSSRYLAEPKKPSKPGRPGTGTKPAAGANFQYAVDRVVAKYGGSAAIAYSDGSTVKVVGDNRPTMAWSTIKVPLAVAALRANRGNYGKAKAAVTYSDNAVTNELWASLPAGSTDKVINEAGSRTAVPTNGWWGNTAWSTSEQAKFVANLPCVAKGREVDALMGQVIAEQRWGLGAIPGTHFKSGWAQSQGRWSIRQMARIPSSRGDVAVAITAIPGNGSYGDAMAMVNELAGQVRGKVGSLPAARCQ